MGEKSFKWKDVLQKDSGSQTFWYETKIVNLKNALFNVQDQIFLNLAWKSLNDIPQYYLF